MTSLQIGPRFNGPVGSGNGGVTAGLLAHAVLRRTRREPGAAEPGVAGAGASGMLRPGEGPGQLGRAVTVTLRLPPPIGRELRLEPDGDGLQLWDDESDPAALVAEAVPSVALPAAVRPVEHALARQAESRYDGLVEHPFPTCFVCGTGRSDGLGVRPGAIDPGEPGRVATTVTLRSDTGLDPEVLVWAALDCPGGWSIDLTGRRAVLGRMTAVVLDRPAPDERCVVTADLDRWEGRKAFSASSLYGTDGRLLGSAAQIWIQLR